MTEMSQARSELNNENESLTPPPKKLDGTRIPILRVQQPTQQKTLTGNSSNNNNNVKPSGECPKIVHFAGTVVDHNQSGSSQRHIVNHNDEPPEILGNGINSIQCPDWSMYDDKDDDDQASHCCDLEFMNNEFKYDGMSVMEFQPDDQEKSTGSMTYTEEHQHNDDDELFMTEGESSPPTNNDVGDQDTTSKSLDSLSLLGDFMSSVLTSTLPLRGHLFDSKSVPRVNLFTEVAHIGEQILRAGVGITKAILNQSDEVMRDDTITYNGYKIHTLGNDVGVNSLILRGVKKQNFRIILQTKDYEGFSHDSKSSRKTKAAHPSSSSSSSSHSEHTIIISEDKWTLIFGNYNDEGTGLVEVEVPPGVSLNDVKTEEPCKGLIFIDVP